MVGAVAMALTSCVSTEEEVVEVVYKLDKDASSLGWKGQKNPEYFHEGTVMFSEGELTMTGDDISNGNITVDMSTIVNTDIEDEGKKGYLEAHLKGLPEGKEEHFFNIQKFATAEVKINGYEKGKLDITLIALGKEVNDKIDVAVNKDDKSITLTGKFSLDLAKLDMPGMMPDPETGEKIQSLVEFDLNLTLKK